MMPKALLPSNEADRLAALHSYQILDTACEDTFDNLTRLAARLTGCPTALVSLVDDDRQWFKSRHGWDAIQTPRDTAFCAHTILDPSRALVVPDAAADIRFADNPLVTGLPGIRFYAGVPLVNPQGYALGTLCTIDYAPKHLDPQDLENLSYLAQAVMSTLELRRATVRAVTMAQAAEDRLARLIEASPTALVVSGQSGQIRLTNQQADRMFGYARGELQGKPLEALLPERVRRQHVGLRQGFLANMSSRMMGQGQALFGLHRDGTEFPLEIGLSPIDLDGEPTVLAGIINVTARHAIEREQEEQRRELARSNADLEEFAYAASHDLKAPLRAISHLAEWINEDIQPTASAETLENLGLLRGRTTRMQMLLDGLLAYARVGHAHTVAEDVDIAAVMHEVVATLAPPLGFVITCEGTIPVIHTHRTPMNVVLQNLVGNALTHHDRTEGCITLRVRRIDDLIEFRVTDDGPGIEARFHDRVFAIFQTLKSRDDVESSGIGLAIVKRRVETHGGRIWIESAPPARGTTFVFTWRETPT
ncbi:MAG: ATP-binding protein [Rhodopila sp.]|jgi:PAS domain S-box-containing protein